MKSANIQAFGSEKEIVGAIHKIEQEKEQVINSRSEPTPKQKTLSTPTQSPNKKVNKYLLLLVLIFVLLGLYLKFKGSNLSTNLLTRQNVTISTEADQKLNQQLKDISGLDWQAFIFTTKGDEKTTLTALLMLYSEEDSTFKPYRNIERAQGFTQDERKLLAYIKVNEEPTKENIQSLFNNLVKLQELYDKKNIEGSNVHLNRLKNLKGYFAKHELSKDAKIPDNADNLTAGFHIAANHYDFAKILLERSNIFLSSVGLDR